MGDVIKHTYDGVVVANGGEMPTFEPLKDGMVQPHQTPADVMLKGTAARVLLGDPALVVCDAFALPPFTTTVAEEAGALRVTAVLANLAHKSTFTDTYHNDLNPQAPFNDRALVQVDVPPAWKSVGKVEVVDVRARGQSLPHRLVGQAMEHDQGSRRLYVQVDVAAQGFQRSAIRVTGATVELVVRRRS